MRQAPTLPHGVSSLPLQGATPTEAAHRQAVQARAGGLVAAALSPDGAVSISGRSVAKPDALRQVSGGGRL